MLDVGCWMYLNNYLSTVAVIEVFAYYYAWHASEYPHVERVDFMISKWLEKPIDQFIV